MGTLAKSLILHSYLEAKSRKIECSIQFHEKSIIFEKNHTQYGVNKFWWESQNISVSHRTGSFPLPPQNDVDMLFLRWQHVFAEMYTVTQI